MKYSIKNFLLESENDKYDDFHFIDESTISHIVDVNIDDVEDFVVIKFFTTYGKEFSLVIKFSNFNNWATHFFNKKGNTTKMFKNYLIDFFKNSKETKEEVNEIIDDTNEIMPDNDQPNNSTNSLVGVDNTMDLEKIFKRSMPKSIRNYSGNLGLGTVVW